MDLRDVRFLLFLHSADKTLPTTLPKARSSRSAKKTILQLPPVSTKLTNVKPCYQCEVFVHNKKEASSLLSYSKYSRAMLRHLSSINPQRYGAPVIRLHTLLIQQHTAQHSTPDPISYQSRPIYPMITLSLLPVSMA